MVHDEKKIIEKPLNQSFDLTPLNRFTGSIMKARKIKLAARPTHGSSTLVLRAWLISVQGLDTGTHPKRYTQKYDGSDRANIINPIHTAHQSSFL